MVELGCWPGGWLQIVAERVGEGGRVYGVDLEPVEPLPAPVETAVLDFTEPDAPDRIKAALGKPARMLLSDAAPKLTGIRDVDRGAQEELHDAVLRVADAVLAERGSVIVKAFPGPQTDLFRKALKQRFAKVDAVEPEGKRKTSKEFYLIGSPERPQRKRRRKGRR